MADTSPGGKVTPQHRQQAREQGRVALSREFVFALTVAMATGAMLWRGPAVLQALREMMLQELSAAAVAPHVGVSLLDGLQRLIIKLAQIISPWLAILAVTAAVGHWVQHGPLWVPSRLKPTAEPLNLMAGWQHWIGRAPFLMTGIGVLKLVLLVLALGAFLWKQADRIIALTGIPAQEVVASGGILLRQWLGLSVVMLAVVGVVDLALRIRRHERDLEASSQDRDDAIRAVKNDVTNLRRRR